MNVLNVSLDNVQLTARRGGMVLDSDAISMKNVDISVEEGPVLYPNNAHNVTLDEVELAYRSDVTGNIGVSVTGAFTESIDLSGVRYSNTAENVSVEPNVPESAIVE